MSSLQHRFSVSILPPAALALCLAFAPSLRAAVAPDESSPEALAQLEQRASQANPREQCFLYAEIVHAMTQRAGRQIADGDTQAADDTLRQVNKYAHLIQLNLVHNAKRLKEAEELMHNTTYRLAEVLHLVSGPDRATVQATLAQVDQVNEQLLNQVFTH